MGKWIAGAVAGLVLLVVGFFAAVMIASETGGETVVLRTLDAQGDPHETSLWVVEDEGAQWLRAGAPTNQWFVRLKANPEVELQRRGEWRDYTAVAVDGRADRINELMARDYPTAELLISRIHDPAAVTAIRLDPR